MTFVGFRRIASDPLVCGGRPVIEGTRMRITDILDMLAGRATPEQIAEDFPYIHISDVHQALAYAATLADPWELSVLSI